MEGGLPLVQAPSLEQTKTKEGREKEKTQRRNFFVDILFEMYA